MKSLSDLKKEISAIENISDADYKEMKPAAVRRMYKKLDLLRYLVKYLETNPSEEFVDAEIKKCERIITAKMNEFNPEKYEKLTKKEVSKLRKAHETKYDIPKMRTHLKNLRMLVN